VKDNGINLLMEVSKMFTLFGDQEPLEIEILEIYKPFLRMLV
jgi:hypothetical protein